MSYSHRLKTLSESTKTWLVDNINYWIVILFLLVFVIIIFLFGYIFQLINLNDETLQGLSTITSAILTVVLAVIYWDISHTQNEQVELQEEQKNIQENHAKIFEKQNSLQRNQHTLIEEQNKIQNGQKKLIRLQQSPVLSVDDVMYAGSSEFHFNLSNLGGGPARDLVLYGEVHLYEWSEDDNALHLIESGKVRETELKRVREYPDDLTIISKGNYLDQREMDVMFAVKPRLRFPEENGFFPAKQFMTEIDNIRRDAAVMVDDQFPSYTDFAINQNSGNNVYSQETFKDLFEDLPFNRVRLCLKIRFSSPVEGDQTKEIDIIAPIRADLSDGEMWEYAMDFAEYDANRNHAQHQQNMDPIAFRISFDRNSEER